MFMWVMPVAFSAIFVVALVKVRGYTVDSSTATHFREALMAAINSLGLTAEERLLRIKIKETGAEIQVSRTSWFGSSQLKPLNKQAKAGMVQIVDEMDKYFDKHAGRTSYMMPGIQLTSGIIMVAMVLWLLLFPLTASANTTNLVQTDEPEMVLEAL